MNKIISFAIVALLSTFALRAQIIFKGKIENLPLTATPKLSVEYWADDRWLEMDSIKLASDKSFKKIITGNYGQVRLRVWGQNTRWIDFIMPQYSSQDSVLDFGTIDYSYIDGNPAKIPGKENEAYYLLLTDYKKYRLLRDSVSKSESLSVQLEQATSLLNKHCKEISVSNKGTLTGDIVANTLYVPVKADYSLDKYITTLSQENFEREHQLDHLPLGDKRVLLHNGLIRVLNNYAYKFREADSTRFIDKVMTRCRGNEEVDAWIFKYLLQLSVNFKDDAVITYLLKLYSPGCSDDEINVDQSTKTLMTALKNCEVGTKAFNLSLPDCAGKIFNVADLAAKSKLTLLFFWRSDCSHCREFEPELEQLYEKYKPLGLEVIGISIDNNEMNWKKYLGTNPMNWTNLHPATTDQRSEISKNFPIPGTPSLIAVDKNFIVKNRMVIRNSLKEYLIQELK